MNIKKLIDGIKDEYKSKSLLVRIIYLILSILVVVCLVREIIFGDNKNIMICIVVLVLFLIPSIIHSMFKISFSSYLEVMIYILIFSSEILGEVFGFYIHIKMFDTMLHILYGFVMSCIGFSLINILNSNRNIFSFAPKVILLFTICYGVTTGAIWEIFEYSVDKIFKEDMQKDTIITEISSIKLNDNDDNKVKTVEIESLIVNGTDYIEKYGGYVDIGLNDTMKDIIINLIGTILFSLFAGAYLEGKGDFVSNFILSEEIR